MALDKIKVGASPSKYKFFVGTGFAVGIASILLIANADKHSDNNTQAQKVESTKNSSSELKGQLEHAKNIGLNLINQEYNSNKVAPEIVKQDVSTHFNDDKTIESLKMSGSFTIENDEDHLKSYIAYKEANKLLDRNFNGDLIEKKEQKTPNVPNSFIEEVPSIISTKAKDNKRKAFEEALKAKTKVNLANHEKPQSKTSQDNSQDSKSFGKNKNQYNPMNAYQIFENDDYELDSNVQNPKTPFALMQGSVISATLTTGINSHLPGQVVAIVSQNVYDSISGDYLLVPRGSKLIGQYNSGYAFGAERLFIGFNRLIFPNGQSLNIGAMPGQSTDGYSGFDADVQNHYFKAIMSSLFLSTIQTQNDVVNNHYDSNDDKTAADHFSKNFSNQNSTALPRVIQASTNITSTLTVKSGYNFSIAITKDIFFKAPYGESSREYYIK